MAVVEGVRTSPPGERPSAPRPPARKPGARKRKLGPRRAPTVRGALLMTVAGGIVPGVGFLYARRPRVGYAVLAVFAAVLVVALWTLPHDVRSLLELAAEPQRSRTLAIGLCVVAAAWIGVVVAQFLVLRPKPTTRWRLVGSSVFVGLLCLLVAVPTVVTTRYAMAQATLVETVFSNDVSMTAPTDVTPEVDPWGGRNRVNVLLLGGDGGEGRDGVRTDSVILLSINVNTGRAVSFSLPRNLQYARFPVDSELAAIYPNGFSGYGDLGNWLLNAVYRQVPALHPEIFAKSDNPGADAVKQAVEGTLGLAVDYYFLVNLKGFQELVDAMGGVTVNINTPVAVGGDTDAGIPPDRWLEPGPDQHLGGFEALWFARGRYGSDDYQRMDRQRCMVQAIVDQARPANLLRRFTAIASATKDMVFTDIPRPLLPDFLELALQVKERRVKSVVFKSSAEFAPAAPDIAWMQTKVHDALTQEPKPSNRGERASEDSRAACAYVPPVE